MSKTLRTIDALSKCQLLSWHEMISNLAGCMYDSCAIWSSMRNTPLGPNQAVSPPTPQHHIHSNFQSLIKKKRKLFLFGDKNNLQRKPIAVTDKESVKQPRRAMGSLVLHGENSDLYVLWGSRVCLVSPLVQTSRPWLARVCQERDASGRRC